MRKKEKMLAEYDRVVVIKNNDVRFGHIANVRKTVKGTLYTVGYADDEHTFYRSYYDNDPAVKIEKDDE